MKIKLKGFLEEIGFVVETQNKKGFIQTVVMHIPGYQDPFGQFSRRDEWPMLSVYSKTENDPKFLNRDLVNKIIEADCSLTFDRIPKKDSQGVILENQFMYFPKVFLGAWRLVQRAEPATQQGSLPLAQNSAAPALAGSDEIPPADDLPF